MNQADSSPKKLYREALTAAALGLAANLLLGAVKLVCGVLGGSFALVSDGVNSVGDSLNSAVVIGALIYSQRPADPKHPYGHSRAETIAATNVALLIVLSALWVGWEAVARLWDDHALPPGWMVWIAAANVAIKEGLYRYKLHVGRRTGSMAVIAGAWDHRCDALASLAVLLGLAAVQWLGPAYIWIDHAAALVVVGLVVFSGARLFRISASELMDQQAGEEFVDDLRVEALEVEGVREVETLLVRKSGLEYFVDIHVGVDADLTVDAGHRIGHAVKDRLLSSHVSLRDVLVHIEPYPHDHSWKRQKPLKAVH